MAPKRGQLSREKNPFWKGGRTIDPRGYVLIKQSEHHRADVRGYVYEHILVAEASLGRLLFDDEEVHHDDENKSNNSPGNLIVASSKFAHHVYHRKTGSRRQLPGEENQFIECSCGCRAFFAKFDKQGRPRAYISGHNTPRHGIKSIILKLLACKPKSSRVISEESGIPAAAVRRSLSKLQKQARVTRVGTRLWILASCRGEVMPNA